MSDQKTTHRPSVAGPVPTMPPYAARPAMILLVVEAGLAAAGLVMMVLLSWQPDSCQRTGGCDVALETAASRLWVTGTIAVLVLSIIATVVCRVRRVNGWWAPLTGIVLIVGINVAVQVMLGVANG